MPTRFLLPIFAPAVLFAQLGHGSLDTALKALRTDTVLVAPMRKVVDPIHWSPDSKAIGIKLDGKWVRVDLDALQLKRFRWRNDQDIAAPRALPDYPQLAETERIEWPSSEEEGSRGIGFRSGVVIELVDVLPTGVAMRIKMPDGRAIERWRTSLETCEALTPSPDGKWIAFLCERHGVAVMRVPEAPPPVKSPLIRRD